jgi:hypothetical protein
MPHHALCLRWTGLTLSQLIQFIYHTLGRQVALVLRQQTLLATWYQCRTKDGADRRSTERHDSSSIVQLHVHDWQTATCLGDAGFDVSQRAKSISWMDPCTGLYGRNPGASHPILELATLQCHCADRLFARAASPPLYATWKQRKTRAEGDWRQLLCRRR